MSQATYVLELEDEHSRLLEALRDTAQATVTALDRLILTTAVCEAAEAYRQVSSGPVRINALRDAKVALWEALEAWRRGKPS